MGDAIAFQDSTAFLSAMRWQTYPIQHFLLRCLRENPYLISSPPLDTRLRLDITSCNRPCHYRQRCFVRECSTSQRYQIVNFMQSTLIYSKKEYTPVTNPCRTDPSYKSFLSHHLNKYHNGLR